MRIRLLIIFGFLPTAIFLSPCGKAQVKESLPNIIIIFTDDQGYGDLGSYGAIGFETPHLDKLAAQGMRFTNFYSGSAVCSPARAALMTGCYPPRIGITKVLFPFDDIGINAEETTIAEMLNEKGYSTAIVGKWHLGHHHEFLPLQHGFDEYFGLPYSNGMWPLDHGGKPVQGAGSRERRVAPPLPVIDGNDVVDTVGALSDQDMLTTRYTERAVDFIERNRKKPFFLYLAHTMPHNPLGVSGKFRGKSAQGLYGDVMMEIDWSVGEVVKALKENGIENNTLVIFTTDNGPAQTYGNHAGSAGGLREAKGSPFEGGFRVPCIMKWPGMIEKGTVCNSMASLLDIFPTLAAITGSTMPHKKIDGINILPLMQGRDESLREEFYYYSGENLNAVRYGNWKLIFPFTRESHVGAKVGADGWPGQTRSVKYEGGLYDLRRDPGERYDLKNEYPDIVKKLEQKAEQMRQELGDGRNNVVGSAARLPGQRSIQK